MSEEKPRPNDILAQMMAKDHFSKWLGIKVLSIDVGYCLLEAKMKKEMLNGFGMVHGGVTFSLADSALAFASNSHGRKAVSIETSITHFKPLYEGEQVLVEAKLENLGNKIATYSVKVKSDKEVTIASFKGTVYRTKDEW